MKPFRNILPLALGDFLAKTLNFVTFVYLARVLGVTSYGVLEFAISLMTYFLLVADGGLEIWAVREAARGEDIKSLAARVLPLRILMAVASFITLLVLIPLFPDYPELRTVLVLFGLTLFAQAASLKWVFMGQEKMMRVAGGLVIAQLVFAVAVFAAVREASDIVWVPALRLIGEGAMALYFVRLFYVTHGSLRLAPILRNAREVLRPAITIGASHGLALINYNFDSILIGFLLGSAAVGLYGAAYKPVTVLLAMPITYFVGLFPALARTYTEDRAAFSQIVTRSFRLTSIFAVPIGVCGYFLAAPVIGLLFGAAYSDSVSTLQVLSWTAALVILRGTYRQSLNAAGRSGLDLRCACAAAVVNVGLNLLMIPRYGILGAAFATLAAEVLWLTLASYYFSRHVAALKLLPALLQPAIAAVGMSGCFWLVQLLFWPFQALIALLVYFVVLLLLGEKEIRFWLQTRKAGVSVLHVES